MMTISNKRKFKHSQLTLVQKVLKEVLQAKGKCYKRKTWILRKEKRASIQKIKILSPFNVFKIQLFKGKITSSHRSHNAFKYNTQGNNSIEEESGPIR